MKRLFVALLSTLAIGLAVEAPSAQAAGWAWRSSAQWGTWSHGGYTLYNDVWGRGAGSQTICASSYSNWQVTANHPNTGGIKSYPNASRSINKSLSSLSSVKSSFNVSVPGSGAYETTYDVWLRNNAFEVMLWMNKTGAVGPLGSVDVLAVLKWIQARGWYGTETLGNVQFGYEITSVSGGKTFTTNSYSVSAS